MEKPNYLSSVELEAVAKLCKTLEGFPTDEISIGAVSIVDVNGEHLGYVALHEGGGYGFYAVQEWVYDV